MWSYRTTKRKRFKKTHCHFWKEQQHKVIKDNITFVDSSVPHNKCTALKHNGTVWLRSQLKMRVMPSDLLDLQFCTCPLGAYNSPLPIDCRHSQSYHNIQKGRFHFLISVSVSESSKPAPCCSRLPVGMLYLNTSLLSTGCHLSCSERNVLYCINTFNWTVATSNNTSDMNHLVYFCPLQYL